MRQDQFRRNRSNIPIGNVFISTGTANILAMAIAIDKQEAKHTGLRGLARRRREKRWLRHGDSKLSN